MIRPDPVRLKGRTRVVYQYAVAVDGWPADELGWIQATGELDGALDGAELMQAGLRAMTGNGSPFAEVRKYLENSETGARTLAATWRREGRGSWERL